jgi:hypothetical protein
MLIEPGLEILLGWCERLALDEPEASTDPAHLYPSVQECGPAVLADTPFHTFAVPTSPHKLPTP